MFTQTKLQRNLQEPPSEEVIAAAAAQFKMSIGGGNYITGSGTSTNLMTPSLEDPELKPMMIDVTPEGDNSFRTTGSNIETRGMPPENRMTPDIEDLEIKQSWMVDVTPRQEDKKLESGQLPVPGKVMADPTGPAADPSFER